ncbi:MAG: TRAP transporter small permease [Pseudomonadota bacterium]
MRSLLTLAAIGFGGTSVVLLMVVSVVDSASRAIGSPILGAKEVSEALLVLCVGAAVPMSILGGRSVTIDGLVAQFPTRVGVAVTWAGVALSVLAIAVLAWRLVGASGDARDFQEASPLLQIPYAPLYLYLSCAHAMAAVAFLIHAFFPVAKVEEH